MTQPTNYSMRPITLSRMIDLCILATSSDYITIQEVANRLKASHERAREMISELKRMKLLDEDNGHLFPTRNTNLLLNAFRSEDWDQFSRYFYRFHPVYRLFIDLMKEFVKLEEGFTIDQIVEHAKKRNLNLNRAS